MDALSTLPGFESKAWMPATARELPVEASGNTTFVTAAGPAADAALRHEVTQASVDGALAAPAQPAPEDALRLADVTQAPNLQGFEMAGGAIDNSLTLGPESASPPGDVSRILSAKRVDDAALAMG